MLQYKYSPGRPDIQFLPPCSTFEIQIYEHYNKEVYNNPNWYIIDDVRLINFNNLKTFYYISLNISM